jgi:hypothetical protein
MANTYKITLVSLNSSNNTANIDISMNGGAVVHITNVAGLPVGNQADFIAAGEAYAIAYYNGLQSQALPPIDPTVSALVGQSATVVV